ncbi:hypothetical protein LIER_41827 [Lithospermum erythrorhizon]|uniref:Uncharacterized protein n=1 Tax=Lithospermum erythrorhizon TaxID=34254 RepID=A0AAV3RJ43_LITER
MGPAAPVCTFSPKEFVEEFFNPIFNLLWHLKNLEIVQRNSRQHRLNQDNSPTKRKKSMLPTRDSLDNLSNEIIKKNDLLSSFIDMKSQIRERHRLLPESGAFENHVGPACRKLGREKTRALVSVDHLT